MCRYRALFFDLSGVLYVGHEVIAGAVEAVARAQASALELRFVTNTSRRSLAQLIADLNAMGFKLNPAQIYTAPVAARDWLLQRRLRPYCLIHPDIRCDFSDCDQNNPNAVLIGDAAEAFCYETLNRAFQLCQSGAQLVGIGCNRYFKLDDQLLLDAGPFIKAIAFAASTEAVIMGKPSRDFFHQVLASTAAKPEQVLMVGDDVFGDIEGAINAGLGACLVKTGKYQLGDENRIEGEFFCVESIVEAVDLALNN